MGVSWISDLLTNAEKTRPTQVPVSERVSLATLESRAVFANGRVVHATVELDKIEQEAKAVISATEDETKATIERLEKHLASVREEYRAKVEKAAGELTAAEASRLEAQQALIDRQIRDGAFEGVRDFNALVRNRAEGSKA